MSELTRQENYDLDPDNFLPDNEDEEQYCEEDERYPEVR